MKEKIKIKSLFISDLHLGNNNSQAYKVLDVFKKYEFENLFLVGDIIDMTYMKRKKCFTNVIMASSCSNVFQYNPS